MLIPIFDTKRIIYRKFGPTGQTITGAYYLEVLKRLIDRIYLIRHEYRDPETWSLLHDNTPSHLTHYVSIFGLKSSLCWIIRCISKLEIERMFF